MARRLGVDISDASVEVAEVSDGGKPSAVALGRVEIPSGLVVRGRVADADKLGKEIGRAMALAKPSRIAEKEAVVNVPESQLFSVWVSTAVKDEGLPMEALRAAQSAFPFAIEDLVIDFTTIRGAKGTRDLFVAAVPKDILTPLGKAIQAAGLAVSAFDIESRALVRAFGVVPKPGEATIFLDIGTRTTIVSIHDSEGLRATVNVAVGGETLTEALAIKLKLDQNKAEAKKRAAGLDPTSEGGKVFLVLQSEIQPVAREALALIESEEKRLGIKVGSAVLSGGTALLPGIAEYLGAALDRPTVVGKLVASLPSGTAGLQPLIYANAVGLALRPKSESLSFLRKIGKMEAAARAEGTAPEPAPAATRPAKRPGQPKEAGAKQKIIMAVIVVVWIAGLVGGTIWYMKTRTGELSGRRQVTRPPPAEVSSQILTVQFDAVADTKPPVADGAISGTLLETVRTAEKPIEPAEKRTEEARAAGTVTLKNTTGNAQSLVVNTRLLSAGGVLFRLKKPVTAPAGGEVTAEVYADAPGAGGNIGPSRFTIPGLSVSLQDKIYAESAGDMTGGVREVGFVAEADVQRILNALREDIVRSAMEVWALELPAGQILVPEAVFYSIASSELPQGGAEVASPKVKATSKVRAVSLDAAALEAVGRSALELPAEQASVYVFSDWKFIVTQYEEDTGLVMLTVTARAEPG